MGLYYWNAIIIKLDRWINCRTYLWIFRIPVFAYSCTFKSFFFFQKPLLEAFGFNTATWSQGAPAVVLCPAVGRQRPVDRGTTQAASLPRRSRRSYLRAKRSARPPGMQVLPYFFLLFWSICSEETLDGLGKTWGAWCEIVFTTHELLCPVFSWQLVAQCVYLCFILLGLVGVSERDMFTSFLGVRG